MQKKFPLLQFLIIIVFFFCACKKDPVPDDTNTSVNLNSGRAGITFTVDINFGGSKTFKVKNTTLTLSTTQPVGSTKRYMVLKAEETYGSLTDTRKATIYITVPVTATLPINIDLATPLSAVPSAQVELYETILGGSFGNTYRSVSGQLHISKLTATEIEGDFTSTVSGSTSPGYIITNGTFAGKF